MVYFIIGWGWCYSTRQYKSALSLNISPKSSERLAFSRFSFWKVAGIITLRLFFAKYRLEYFRPLLLQVARKLVLTLTFIRELNLYWLLIFRISTFKEWFGFRNRALGIKPNFFRPFCILAENISFKSFWADMLNFLIPYGEPTQLKLFL